MGKHTDINAKDNMKRTALHYAACFNNTDIVELLLETEAKTNIKDNNGKKPLSFAKNKEIIDLLRGLLARSLSNVMVSCLLPSFLLFAKNDLYYIINIKNHIKLPILLL